MRYYSSFISCLRRLFFSLLLLSLIIELTAGCYLYIFFSLKGGRKESESEKRWKLASPMKNSLKKEKKGANIP